MLKYITPPLTKEKLNGFEIASFNIDGGNIDIKTVNSFGEEWEKFSSFTPSSITNIGNLYFDILTEEMYGENKIALDIGCGTGRWTKYLASKFGHIDAVDPSNAIISASKLLKGVDNVRLTKASLENLPFEDESYDFVYSIGVLHHIPDTKKAIKQCVQKLKTGGYFYTYLYYDLGNRGLLFKTFFKISNVLRYIISKLPSFLKKIVCDILAIVIYLPLIGLSKILKALFPTSNTYTKIPLSFYHDKTLNVIRNDSLDRFGTPLEQRFSKEEIRNFFIDAGLGEVIFSNNEPYWHVIGKKVAPT